MGMSIDEAVNVIHKMLAYTDLSVRANLKADMIDACHMAIDTMRKYQKIEQIMERTVDDGTSMYDTLQEIEEVIEDATN